MRENFKFGLALLLATACAQPPSNEAVVAKQRNLQGNGNQLPAEKEKEKEKEKETNNPSPESPSMTESPAAGPMPEPSPAPGPGPGPVVQNPTPTPPGPTPMPEMMPVPAPTPMPPVISNEGDGRFNLDNWREHDPRTKSRGALKGKIEVFEMQAKDSKIFPRVYNDATNKNQKDRRRIEVYLPPGIDKAKEYPFMIAMDADYWTEPLKTTIDNLIQDKKIPPMIAVFAANGGGDSRGQQRGLEYDTVGPDNAKFFATEVLPEIEKRFGVKFTKDGEGGGMFGGSSSGAAAFTACWFMPERFRKVLGYSSTFTSQGGGAGKQYPDGAKEYQAHLIKEAPLKPIRLSLQVSSNDNNFFDSTTQMNIKTYEALKDKGYHVRFQVMKDAAHVDGNAMRHSIADNMIWLWRDYPK